MSHPLIGSDDVDGRDIDGAWSRSRRGAARKIVVTWGNKNTDIVVIVIYRNVDENNQSLKSSGLLLQPKYPSLKGITFNCS